MYTSCRTRFYSFGAVKPFVYYSGKEYHVSDQSDEIIIDIEEQDNIPYWWLLVARNIRVHKPQHVF
jgi:hypothetical protein